MSELKLIDLFAGCGGMSLGLQWAGFMPLVAIEHSEMAAETYFHNFHRSGDPDKAWADHLGFVQNKDYLNQAKRGVVAAGVEEVLKDDATMQWLKAQQVDVLVGGPPCQGFSMAGRRNSDDHRNQLPEHFLEYIEELRPRAVVVENVLGINRLFAASARREAPAAGEVKTLTDFEELCKRIGEIKVEVSGVGEEGYVVQRLELDAAHYGVPQHRTRMFIVALRTDGPPLEELWRSRDVWEAKDGPPNQPEIPLLAPRPGLSEDKYHHELVPARDALCDLSGDGTYKDPGERPPKPDYEEKASRYAWAMRNNQNRWPQEPDSHEYRKHNAKTKARFRLYRELDKLGIPRTVFARTDRPSEQARIEAAKNFLGAYSLDDDELAEKIAHLPTRKHSQQVLDPDQPSPTVLTIPDDLVHPAEDRVMTVRELARLQSFPDWFQFRGKMTTGGRRRKTEVPRYTQVGNAVPPLLAKAIGERLRQLLS